MALRFQRRGPVALVTIDRPRVLNAIDPETDRELVAAWTRFRDDPKLGAAVLTGAGGKAFSVGIDLTRLDEFYAERHPGERRERWMREPGLGGLTRNLDPGKPVVAAIRGYCFGGGLELALACDLRLASPDARFALPETRWGILPGQGGTQRLPRTIPTGIALEMILSGESLTARRAYEVGLVNRVVPAARLLPEALSLARRIAERPSVAVRRAREAVLRGRDLPLPQGLALEQELADPLRGVGKGRQVRAAFAGRKAPPKRAKASRR